MISPIMWISLYTLSSVIVQQLMVIINNIPTFYPPKAVDNRTIVPLFDSC